MSDSKKRGKEKDDQGKGIDREDIKEIKGKIPREEEKR